MVTMYYGRFTEQALKVAHGKGVVTTEHFALITNFYKTDVFILRGQEMVERLKTIIPNVTEQSYDPEQDLYFIHVDEWPHFKPICLLFAFSKPCRWMYKTEDHETVLFEYHIDTFSIHLTN